jgi:hypothetical protein
LLLLLSGWSIAAPVQAQAEVERLEQLVVDIWPDYDRRDVLVLLTGRLPAEAALPAELAIPIPEGATIHAVASVSTGNQMFETPYTLEEGQLRFTTPEQRFRVEYYMPYEADGLARSFVFEWQSPLAIDDLNVSVQQPLAATTLTTEPAAEVVGEGNDGLTYHDLVQPLPAGETFRLEVDYTLSNEQLTAPPATAAPSPGTADEAEAEAAPGVTMNWPLFLGGAGILIILLALVWQLFGRRANTARPPRKPAVHRPAAPARRASASRQSGPARFCHNCGAAAQPEDRFCRSCGTELKR